MFENVCTCLSVPRSLRGTGASYQTLSGSSDEFTSSQRGTQKDKGVYGWRVLLVWLVSEFKTIYRGTDSHSAPCQMLMLSINKHRSQGHDWKCPRDGDLFD